MAGAIVLDSLSNQELISNLRQYDRAFQVIYGKGFQHYLTRQRVNSPALQSNQDQQQGK